MGSYIAFRIVVRPPLLWLLPVHLRSFRLSPSGHVRHVTPQDAVLGLGYCVLPPGGVPDLFLDTYGLLGLRFCEFPPGNVPYLFLDTHGLL